MATLKTHVVRLLVFDSSTFCYVDGCSAPTRVALPLVVRSKQELAQVTVIYVEIQKYIVFIPLFIFSSFTSWLVTSAGAVQPGLAWPGSAPRAQ